MYIYNSNLLTNSGRRHTYFALSETITRGDFSGENSFGNTEVFFDLEKENFRNFKDQNGKTISFFHCKKGDLVASTRCKLLGIYSRLDIDTTNPKNFFKEVLIKQKQIKTSLKNEPLFFIEVQALKPLNGFEEYLKEGVYEIPVSTLLDFVAPEEEENLLTSSSPKVLGVLSCFSENKHLTIKLVIEF